MYMQAYVTMINTVIMPFNIIVYNTASETQNLISNLTLVYENIGDEDECCTVKKLGLEA